MWATSAKTRFYTEIKKQNRKKVASVEFIKDKWVKIINEITVIDK